MTVIIHSLVRSFTVFIHSFVFVHSFIQIIYLATCIHLLIYISYYSFEDMVDYRSYAAVKLKPVKNSGLNGIRTHDLCDNGAGYQLNYQANWELVTVVHWELAYIRGTRGVVVVD